MSANPNLPRVPRSVRAGEVARLHAAGLNGLQIAREMGISRSLAYELLTDPSGEKTRARKARYDGVCSLCGGRTSGRSSGVDRIPEMCRSCAQQRYWTEERVIAAIRMWADEHGGIPPRSMDWGNRANTNVVPSNRTDEWPSFETVRKRFGTFNDGVRAAGLEPYQERTTGRYTPEVLSDVAARVNGGESLHSVSRDYGERWGLCDSAVAQALRYRGITPRSLKAAA